MIASIITGSAGVLAGWLAARANQRGQRRISADGFLREKRYERIKPLLDSAAEHSAIYRAVASASVNDKSEALIDAITRLYSTPMEDRYIWSVPFNSDVFEVIEFFVGVDSYCSILANDIGNVDRSDRDDKDEEVNRLSERLNQATGTLMSAGVALHIAMEGYLTSDLEAGHLYKRRFRAAFNQALESFRRLDLGKQ